MSNFIQADSQHLQQIAQNQTQQAQETQNTQKVQEVQQKDIDDFNHAMENSAKTGQASQEAGKNTSLSPHSFDSSPYAMTNGSQIGQGQALGQSLGQNQNMSLEEAFSMAQAKAMSQNTAQAQNQTLLNSQNFITTQGQAQNAEQLAHTKSDFTKLQEMEYSELEDSKTKMQNPFAQASNPLATNIQNSNPIAPTQSTAPSTQINEKLVESILVSQAGADTQEVRLTVSKSILPDTEIIMNRDIHGTLNVTLTTNNASSFQTLVAAQHDLNAMLARSESDIKITVQSGDQQNKQHGDQNNPNQRSNGLIDFDNEQV